MSCAKTYLTCKEAAKRIGVSACRVRQYIKVGRIKTTRFGRAHQILISDVAKFVRNPPGAPRTKNAK